ncbi:hypothetical protein BKA57DRAFT_153898 [Linnemannia elongata]|nr:hypothetical protein BKA57DRAFT_153898 [Linnemannia elongata]
MMKLKMMMMMMISQKSLFIPASLFFLFRGVMSCYVMPCRICRYVCVVVLLCVIFMLGPVMQDEKTLSFVYISSLPFPFPFPVPSSFNQSINQSFQQKKGVIVVAPLLSLFPPSLSLSLPLSFFPLLSQPVPVLCSPSSFLSFFLVSSLLSLLFQPPSLSSSFLPHLPTLFFFFFYISAWISTLLLLEKLSSETTLLKNNHWGGGMRVGRDKVHTRGERDQTNHLSPRTGSKKKVCVRV